MSGGLEGAAEDNVITLLVWNTQHATTLASVLDADLFTTQHYRKVAERAIDYVNRFSNPPQGHIRDLMERELRHATEGKYVAQLLDAMQELQKEIQPDYVMAELDKFIRVQTKIRALDDAYTALSQGDEDKADELLWQQAGFKSRMTKGVWLHDDNLDFLDRQENDYFSSGILELDKRGIRPERGTFTLFIAPKKAGKSWWCISLGKAGLQYGHTVLHLTLENSANLTKRRYLQACFAMTKREAQTVSITRFDTDLATGKFIRLREEKREAIPLIMDNRREIVDRIHTLLLRPRLMVKEWPTGALTIPQLNAYLDMLAREDNFVPDLLIVDYPDLMHIDTRDLRANTGTLYKQLRGIAVSRNMALCAPTQGNRSTEGAKRFGSKGVSEDWSKVGTADTVLTFNRTDYERDRGLARVLVDAARDEEDKFMVWISQQYATGQFCIDSVYMDKVASSEFDQLGGNEQIEDARDERDEAEEGEE